MTIAEDFANNPKISGHVCEGQVMEQLKFHIDVKVDFLSRG